jgi:hypothetical protein
MTRLEFGLLLAGAIALGILLGLGLLAFQGLLDGARNGLGA